MKRSTPSHNNISLAHILRQRLGICSNLGISALTVSGYLPVSSRIRTVIRSVPSVQHGPPDTSQHVSHRSVQPPWLRLSRLSDCFDTSKPGA